MANMKGVAVGVITSIIAIILVMQIFGNTAGEIIAGANNVTYRGNDSALPLTGVFSSSGVIMLIIVAGILLLVIGMALKGFNK